MLRAVCNVVAVLALPVKAPVTLPVTLPVNAAVIVPAVKLPLASRATIALAVLALAAVVAELLTLPVVLIVDSFVSAILPANIALVTAPALIVNAVEPPVLPVPVTSPVNVNEPEIATVETAVTKPFALTVTTGIAVAEPNDPVLLLTVASVNA